MSGCHKVNEGPAFTVAPGEDLGLEFTIHKDENGDDVTSLVGWGVRLLIKKRLNDADADAVISVKSGDAGYITDANTAYLRAFGSETREKLDPKNQGGFGCSGTYHYGLKVKSPAGVEKILYVGEVLVNVAAVKGAV